MTKVKLKDATKELLKGAEDIIIQDTLYMEKDIIKLLTYAASAVPATTADGVSGYLFALIFN